jgi:hypothetical protein
MYQKFPICNGEGVILNISIKPNDTSVSSSPVTKICPTCLGTRIISKLTGLPPTHNHEPQKNNLINLNEFHHAFDPNSYEYTDIT